MVGGTDWTMIYHNLKVLLCANFAGSVFSSIDSDFRAFVISALLSVCIKEEIRGVVSFPLPEGTKPEKIIRRMQHQYGESCLSELKQLLVDKSLYK